MLTNRTRALAGGIVGPLAAGMLVVAGAVPPAAATPVTAAAAALPPADGGGWTDFAVHQAWTDSATPTATHLDEGTSLPFGLIPRSGSADGRAHDRVAYLEFDATRYPGAVLGDVVLGAGVDSASTCPAAPVEVWRTASIGTAPTAAHPPARLEHLATLTWQVAPGGSTCSVSLDVTAAFTAARAAGEPSVTVAFVRPADLATARRSAGTLTRYSNVQGTYQYPVAAPVDLHPSGTGPNERYQRSPVTFRADPGNPGNRRSSIGFQIQRAGAGGAWVPAASPVTSGTTTQPLPDGDVRWRARTVLDTTIGPWSRWTTITVDSRTPAAPVVSIPAGTVTVGRPVDVTISSPDGVAALYYLSQFPDDASYGIDQDPCTIGHGFVCPTTLGGSVTVPWTFLSPFVDQLYVHAYGRGGTVSAASDRLRVSPQADTAAVSEATRWNLPTADGPAASIPATAGGPSLRVGPVVRAATQQLTERGAPDATVPSIDTAASTAVRTAGTVVDTASTFTVAAVVSRPADTDHDVTLFDQPARGGTSFSLVLTRQGYWQACVTTTDAQQGCQILVAFAGGDTEAVAVSVDVVSRSFTVTTNVGSAQPQEWPGTSGLRPALGGLRFAYPAVAGSAAYTGLLGNPLVARGWVTGADVAASLVVS